MNINIMKCKLVKDRTIEYGQVLRSEDAVAILRKIGLHEEAEEVFSVLCFASNGRLIGYHEISRGEVSSAPVHPREVFKRVLLNNASGIIIAHNHPSGNLNPSMADRTANSVIKKAAELLGIRFMDSIIVTHDGYYNFRSDEPEFFSS